MYAREIEFLREYMRSEWELLREYAREWELLKECMHRDLELLREYTREWELLRVYTPRSGNYKQGVGII